MKKYLISIIILLLPLLTVSAQFTRLIIQPRWSPDGTQLTYWMDGDIWLVNADGSNPRNMTDIIAASVNPAQWSADSAYLVFWYNGHLWWMNAADKSLDGLTFSLTEQPSEPVMSPQANVIAYTTQNAVYRQQIPDGEPQLLASNLPDTSEILVGALRWSPDGQSLAFLASKSTAGDANTPDNALWVVNADGSNLRQLQILYTAQGVRWVDNSHLMISALTTFDDPGVLLSYTGISAEENTVDYLNANQLTESFDAAVYSLSPGGQFLAHTNYELQDLDQDGSSIEATFTINPEIIVLDILNRQRLSIQPSETANFNIAQAIYWLNEGSFIILNQCENGTQSIWFMPLSGEGRELVPCGTGQMTDVSLAPDKQQLSLILVQDGIRHLYVLNIADGNLRNLNVP